METYSCADSQLPTHTDGRAEKSISLFRLIIKCVHPKKVIWLLQTNWIFFIFTEIKSLPIKYILQWVIFRWRKIALWKEKTTPSGLIFLKITKENANYNKAKCTKILPMDDLNSQVVKQRSEWHRQEDPALTLSHTGYFRGFYVLPYTFSQGEGRKRTFI